MLLRMLPLFFGLQNLKVEAEWSKLLERIYIRHTPTLITMARAIFEMKRKQPSGQMPHDAENTIYPFLDRCAPHRPLLVFGALNLLRSLL